MAIFRWGSAFEAFRDLEREMDRWFRHLDMVIGPRAGRVFPLLNLFDLEGEYVLVGELPGVLIEDLEVSVTSGQLLLAGERRNVGSIPEDKFRRSERPSGRWERTVQLPPRIQEDGIRAELTNGILKLHLPKIPETKPRRINIDDASPPALPGGES